MSSTHAPAKARHARRIHYVDERIQKWLLVALVIMEAALAGAAVGVLNWHLTGVIEENLYRVHLAEAQPLFDQLLQGALKVLGMFILINGVALLAADAIWRHYVSSVVHDLMALIGRTGELDFSPDPETAHGHEVLALARTWRARERARLAAIREQLVRLEREVSARSDPRGIRAPLDLLDELLP